MQTPRHDAVTLLAASSLTVMSGATIAPALPAIRDAYADGRQADLLTKLVLTPPGAADRGHPDDAEPAQRDRGGRPCGYQDPLGPCTRLDEP